MAEYTDYFGALFNTAWISTLYALLQVLCCALVGYGLAKFRFRGKGVLFALVIFTMIIPPQATVNALYMNFRYFNPLGIFGLFSKQLPNLVDSPYPMILLSSCGLALKNGLYIVLMRQFYKGVPDEMIEAAEVDGAGAVRTFVRIIFPMTTPMLVTIFLLAFSWQWTDVYYSGLLFQDFNVLSNIVMRVGQIGGEGYQGSKMSSVLINTASIMVITPLLILYLFAQKKLIQGIERTGLVG